MARRARLVPGAARARHSLAPRLGTAAAAAGAALAICTTSAGAVPAVPTGRQTPTVGNEPMRRTAAAVAAESAPRQPLRRAEPASEAFGFCHSVTAARSARSARTVRTIPAKASGSVKALAVAALPPLRLAVRAERPVSPAAAGAAAAAPSMAITAATVPPVPAARSGYGSGERAE